MITCYVDWLLDHNELRMVLWSTPHNALTSLGITSTCFCLKLQVWASLLWGHYGRDGVSNHQPRDCLLNRSFRRRSKKTLKLRVTVLCAGNSPVTSEFPAQMASNAENVSIWWRHHVFTRALPLRSTTIKWHSIELWISHRYLSFLFQFVHLYVITQQHKYTVKPLI